jgi:hypothetical protein
MYSTNLAAVEARGLLKYFFLAQEVKKSHERYGA